MFAPVAVTQPVPQPGSGEKTDSAQDEGRCYKEG